MVCTLLFSVQNGEIGYWFSKKIRLRLCGRPTSTRRECTKDTIIRAAFLRLLSRLIILSVSTKTLISAFIANLRRSTLRLRNILGQTTNRLWTFARLQKFRARKYILVSSLKTTCVMAFF